MESKRQRDKIYASINSLVEKRRSLYGQNQPSSSNASKRQITLPQFRETINIVSLNQSRTRAIQCYQTDLFQTGQRFHQQYQSFNDSSYKMCGSPPVIPYVSQHDSFSWMPMTIVFTDDTQRSLVPGQQLFDPDYVRVINYDILTNEQQQISCNNVVCSQNEFNEKPLMEILVMDSSLIQIDMIVEIRIFSNESGGWIRGLQEDLEMSVNDVFAKYMIADNQIFLRIFQQTNQINIIELQQKLAQKEDLIKFLQRQLELNAIDGTAQVQVLNQKIAQLDQQCQQMEHLIQLQLEQQRYFEESQRKESIYNIGKSYQNDQQQLDDIVDENNGNESPTTMKHLTQGELKLSESTLITIPDSLKTTHGLMKHRFEVGQRLVEKPDLVFFYADPLMYQLTDQITLKKSLQSFETLKLALDMEFTKLCQTIRETEKEFKISKQPINFESVKTWMAKKPRILHISCHGDYDKQKKEFYLQFEGIGEKLGIDDRVHQSRLKQLLGSDGDHGIQLAFVSACFSEQIGKVLLDCNIPFVISVNSTQKIADEICLLFSRHLYMHLLQGKSIRRAFEQAQSTCRGSDIKYASCCCAHSHAPDCKWEKYKEVHGQVKAHELHFGDCDCDLGLGKHKRACEIFHNFMKVMREFRDPVRRDSKPKNNLDIFGDFEELDVEDALNFEQNLTGFDTKAENNMMCCCQKEKPHDESMKFVLLCKENESDKVIFEEREMGGVSLLNPPLKNIYLPSIYDNTILIGRNKEIQKIVSLLTSEKGQRIIKVCGGSGLGKKCCVIQAVRYCTERNYFRDGATCLEIENQTSCTSFQNLLFKRLRLEIKHIDDLFFIIQDWDMVLIINDCEHLLLNQTSEFQKILTGLIEKTTNLKIVLVLKEEVDVQINGASLSNKVIIKPLKKQDAVRYFKGIDKDNLLPSEEILQKDELFDKELSNEELMDIYQHWMSNPQSFNLIQLELMKNSSLRRDSMKSQHGHSTLIPKEGLFIVKKNLFKKMETDFPNQISLLYILSFAPNGLIYEDIELAAKVTPSIKDGWEEFFEEIQLHDGDEQHEAASHLPSEKCNHCHKALRLVIKVQDEDLGECIYRVKKNERDFINKELFDQKSRPYRFVQYVKSLSKISRYLLQSIKNQWKTDFDINLLSAHIDTGLWSSTRYNVCNFITDSEKIPLTNNPDVKFNLYWENYLCTFNYDVIIDLFPNKFDKNMEYAVQFFDEVWITFISILVMLKREDEALTYIDEIKVVSEEFDLKFITAKLNLIQASILISLGNVDLSRKIIVQIEKFFKQCSIHSRDGAGEAILLKALHEIAESKSKSDSSRSFNFSRQTSQKVKVQVINKTQEEQIFQIGNNSADIASIYNRQETLFFKRNILSTLQKAKEAFLNVNNQLGVARVILITANFLSQTLDIVEDSKDLNGILPNISQAKKIFEEKFCMEHQGSCAILIAKIKLKNNQLQEAKDALNESIYLAKNMRNQLQLKEVNILLDEVMFEIQKKCNNLIVFLSSYPLVSTNQKGEIAEIKADQDFNPQLEKFGILQPLSQMNKQINVKIDILTVKQLKSIAINGCRILVINQPSFGSSNLVVERGDGRFSELSSKELTEILRQNNSKINIDAVFLNIPGGIAVAKVFKDLGVGQIFLYDKMSTIGSVTASEFMRYTTTQMIKQLIQEQTFHQAFSKTVKEISQNSMISDYKDALMWFHGRKENPGGKIFDHTSFDELLHLGDGAVEDQSNVQGTTNINQIQSTIGRKIEITNIVSKLMRSKTKFVTIHGSKGIGKTRLAQEVALFINQRGGTPDGVFLLDFQNVTHQLHINKLFQTNGIEYVLEKMQSSKSSMSKDQMGNLLNRSKSQWSRDSADEYKLLLIYDNVELFKQKKTLFQWHIRKIASFYKNIKMIFTSQTPIDYFKENDQTLEIELKPLSQKDSLKLVKDYSLKKNLFNNQSQGYHSPLNEAMLAEKIKHLGGNPLYLITLSMVLRAVKLENVKIQTKEMVNLGDFEDSVSQIDAFSSHNNEFSFRRQTKKSFEKCSTFNFDKLSIKEIESNFRIKTILNNDRSHSPQPLFQLGLRPQKTTNFEHPIMEEDDSDSMHSDNSLGNLYNQDLSNNKLQNNFKRVSPGAYLQPTFGGSPVDRKLRTSTTMIEKKNEDQFPKIQQDYDTKSVKKQKQFSQVTQIQVFGIYELNRHVEVFKNHKFEDLEALLNLNFFKLMQVDNELNGRLTKMHDILKMKECLVHAFIKKSSDALSVFLDRKDSIVRDAKLQPLTSFRGDMFQLRRISSINTKQSDWFAPRSVLILFPVTEPAQEEQQKNMNQMDDQISSASSFIIDGSSDSERERLQFNKITVGKLN